MKTHTSKHIVLCADDYGYNPAVSKAIIQLIQMQRLSATSCMTNSTHWPEHAAWLQPYHKKIDIGLHLNFTDGKPLSDEYAAHCQQQLPRLAPLIARSFLHRSNKSAIAAELQQQLDRFIEYMGKAPDFIDGHQHIHQLPVFRDALITLYQRNPSLQNTYIRLPSNGLLSCFTPKRHWLKSAIITATGSEALRRQLQKHRIAYNRSFSGIYNFKHAKHYRRYFCRFLQHIKSGGLIMCHPGLKADKLDDPIANSRWQEYFYMQSNEFQDDCCRYGITLGRFKAC